MAYEIRPMSLGDIYLGRPSGAGPALRRAWALFLPLLGAAVGTVVATVGMAYLIAVTVVFYFALRCRRDTFDLEHLARASAPHGVYR